MTSYQEELPARFAALEIAEPPAPWWHVASIAIGGFQALGFSHDSQYILVVSSSGRGVLESVTGFRVARDRTETGDWYDLEKLEVEGVGPLAGQTLPVAGIHGGGLPMVTSDGWSVDLLSPRWPAGFVTLSSMGSSPWIGGQHERVTKVAPVGGDDMVRCFGFSWSRRHLVVATGHTLDLFSR